MRRSLQEGRNGDEGRHIVKARRRQAGVYLCGWSGREGGGTPVSNAAGYCRHVGSRFVHMPQSTQRTVGAAAARVCVQERGPRQKRGATVTAEKGVLPSAGASAEVKTAGEARARRAKKRNAANTCRTRMCAKKVLMEVMPANAR